MNAHTKNNFQKRSTYKKRPAAVSAKYIKQLVDKEIDKRAEPKESTLFALDSVTATGTTATICSIAEGSDFNNRIGRRVRVKHIVVSALLSLTTTQKSDNGFIFIGIDRQPDGSNAPFNLYYDTGGNSGSPPAGLALRNTNITAERIKILRRVPYSLSQSGPSTCKLDFYIPCKNLNQWNTVEYLGSASGITNIGTNNFVIGYGGNALIIDPTTIEYSVKFVFTDL
jgi:hypothetical protein